MFSLLAKSLSKSKKKFIPWVSQLIHPSGKQVQTLVGAETHCHPPTQACGNLGIRI